jgi:hypothetical protein
MSSQSCLPSTIQGIRHILFWFSFVQSAVNFLRQKDQEYAFRFVIVWTFSKLSWVIDQLFGWSKCILDLDISPIAIYMENINAQKGHL